MTITGETDRMYLDTAGPVAVDDPALGRRLVVSKERQPHHGGVEPLDRPGAGHARTWGTTSTGLMVCVETANALQEYSVTPGAGREPHACARRLAVG